MNKYRNAIEKITASDELKKETVKKMEASLAQTRAAASAPGIRRPLIKSRPARYAAIGSMAAVFLFCAIFIPVLIVLTGNPGVTPDPSEKAKQGIFDKILTETPVDVPTDLDGLIASLIAEADDFVDGGLAQNAGGYIHKLSAAGLIISQGNNETNIVSSVAYENFVPVALYISANRLVTAGGIYANGDGGYQKTQIVVYDIADRSSVKEIKRYEVSGSLLTARLSGSRLVLAINYYVGDIGDTGTFLPKIGDTEIDAEKVFIYEGGSVNYRNYIVTASIGLDTADLAYTAHLGLNVYDTVYAAQDALYVCNIDFSDVDYKIVGAHFQQTGVVYTKIYKIGYDTLARKAQGEVDGAVLSRYCLDEFEGDLRAATFVPYRDYLNAAPGQSYTDISYTNVYVLGGDLGKIGSVENIALGEQFRIAQFDKTAGTLIIGESTYALDLSDPKNLVLSKK